MSQELDRENKMLKEYIAALERENSSRNIEKDVLLREIDNLNSQNDRLRLQKKSSLPTNNNAQQQIQAILRSKRELETRFGQAQANLQRINRIKIELESENMRLKNQSRDLNASLNKVQLSNNQASKLQLTNLKKSYDELAKRNTTLQSKQQEIIKLEIENKNLEFKITQAQSQVSHLQSQLKAESQQTIKSKLLLDSRDKEALRLEAQVRKMQQISHQTQVDTGLSLKIKQSQQQSVKLQQKNKELTLQLSEITAKLQSEKSLRQQNSHSLRAMDQQKRHELKNEYEQQKLQQIKQMEIYFARQIQQRDSIIQRLSQEVNQNMRKARQYEGNSNTEIIQLRNLKHELENRLRSIEQQNKSLQQKIDEMQLQVNKKTINFNKQKDQTLEIQRMKVVIERRDIEVMQSRSIIEALRSNANMLQMKVKALQQSIQQSKHQTSIGQGRNHLHIKSVQSSYQQQIRKLNLELKQHQQRSHQIHQQRKILIQKQRQNEELKKIISELNSNNRQLLQKIKNHQFQDSRVQRQNQKSVNEQDLRGVVLSLKEELKQVKSQFRRMEYENKKRQSSEVFRNVDASSVSEVYAQPIQGNINKSYDFMQKKPYQNIDFGHNNQFDQHQVKYTKLRNQAQKFKVISNQSQLIPEPKKTTHNKWQMLQKRITQLREENAELKNSLNS